MNPPKAIALGAAGLESLQAYRRRGWSPVPVRYRDKVPAVGAGWQNFEGDNDADFTGNIGIILGQRSGGLVDVDLDCQEAIALASAILPPTGAVFGRPSKPRSHWIYQTVGPTDTAQFQTKQDGMLAELRSTGCQTVFPPSIHKSGEEITWSAGFDAPAQVNGDDLARAVRELSALAMLVRHWPAESGRYNAEGALIGSLLRAGWVEEDVEKALKLIRVHAGEAPRHPTETIVPRFAKRLKDGKSVPGLKRLTELLGAEVGTKAAEWLDLKRSARQSSYQCRDSGTYQSKSDKDGIPHEIKLANFSGEITHVVIRDDGTNNPDRSFVVKSGDDQAEIPAAEFDSMGWVTALWGPTKSVAPGIAAKAHMAEAIKDNSPDVEYSTIYTHTGWIISGGENLYLHAGGAIGSSGAVEGYAVELSGKLKNYVLPPPKDLGLAIRASLSIRELGAVGTLMLASVYRAPLAEFLEINNSVFVEGKTGTFKSAVQGLALSHWGAYWDGTQFPANWTGTANSLEKVGHSLKDALCVVDDFKPSGPSYEVEKLHQTAERLLRAAANHGGRSRMNADSTLRTEYFPRGLVMSSGEDVPKGHSLRSRMFLHRTEKADIDVSALTQLQAMASKGLMAESMAGYVQWLAGHASKAFREKLRLRYGELRSEVTGDHARTPGNIASLLVGIDCLVEFANDSGAMSKAEAEQFQAEARDLLMAQAKVQDAEQASEDPGRTFVDFLSEALAARRVHLATRNGDAPAGMEAACGWRERQLQDSITWQPSGDGIGWIENETVFLRSSIAFAAAENLCRQQNRSLGVTKETLFKRLMAAGYIERSTTVRAEGTVNRIYPMKAEHLLGIKGSEGSPVVHDSYTEFLAAARKFLPKAKGKMRALIDTVIESAQRELWEQANRDGPM